MHLTQPEAWHALTDPAWRGAFQRIVVEFFDNAFLGVALDLSHVADDPLSGGDKQPAATRLPADPRPLSGKGLLERGSDLGVPGLVRMQAVGAADEVARSQVAEGVCHLRTVLR